MKPIFITGIGTDVGKTVIAAIVTEVLGAAYWKPMQAGFDQGTDTEWVAERLSQPRMMPEVYKLALPASPHLAARKEGVVISLDRIAAAMPLVRPLVVEGAGGLLVPLNETEFVADLVEKLDARVVLVSRNYLGSINHSLMTAAACKARGLDVAGWVFNGEPSGYENDIVKWSGVPLICSVPMAARPDKEFVREQADHHRMAFLRIFMG